MYANARVGRYLSATPPAISGNHGHTQTFKVACDLVHGWALPPLCALTWLRIYNQRCQPRWTSEELRHKIESAAVADRAKPRGHLLGLEGGSTPLEVPSKPRPPIPQFDREAFRRFIADHVPVPVDADWLRQRSPIDPGNQTPASFLWALFAKGERVLIFDSVCSRGKAIWTHPGPVVGNGPPSSLDRRFAKGAREGIWFLANPVDGEWRINAAGRSSLRSEGNVTAWRYLVLESDRDDIREEEWLAFIAALALPVASIVETGRRLAHALIRVDAETKAQWDHVRNKLAPLLIRGGADPGSLSALRLTRLAGCERLGWRDDGGEYLAFPDGPHLQRLLYLNPQPDCTPIGAGRVVCKIP